MRDVVAAVVDVVVVVVVVVVEVVVVVVAAVVVVSILRALKANKSVNVPEGEPRLVSRAHFGRKVLFVSQKKTPLQSLMAEHVERQVT